MSSASQSRSASGNDVLDTSALLKTLMTFRDGDFSARLPVGRAGVAGIIASTLNDVLTLSERLAGELARVSIGVGKQGRIDQRVTLRAASGRWAECADSVNSLVGDLVQPSVELTRVIGAVAAGDLSQAMPLEVHDRSLQGEFLHTARVVNTMVAQLNSFASELTRVAREISVEGNLGAQALVPGAAGIWRDLTDDFNQLAANLATHARAVGDGAAALTRAIPCQLTQGAGIALDTFTAAARMEQLLKQSQGLAGQLRKANAELEEKTRLLAGQKNEVETRNREAERARAALEEKAEQLSLASRHKSDFLANMSHELRTPLNNLLILARMLAENREGTLTPRQIRYSEAIHSSATDLLALINDVLDFSKIESGKMDVEVGSVRFTELRDLTLRAFRHVAEAKGLDFSIELAGSLPAETIVTDVRRLRQVLRNLLSNALKFTERGSVRLRMEHASGGWISTHPVLDRGESVIAFSVADTGIGIPPDKQRMIFEAFQQADGATSRKYGGTGLGLSISRELTVLLGGEIRVQSSPGAGSTFTLYLPQTYVAWETTPEAGTPLAVPPLEQSAAPAAGIHREAPPLEQSAALSGGVNREAPSPRSPAPAAGVNREAAAGETRGRILPPPSSVPAVALRVEIQDDRNRIGAGDPVLLVVEEDAAFARVLMDLARGRGIRVLAAASGAMALSLARQFVPGAITLDIGLPDMAGWTLIDRLKHDPSTRHIPVHVIGGDENPGRTLAFGALAYLEKSIARDRLNEAFDVIQHSLQPRVRKLLIVSGERSRLAGWLALLSGSDVQTLAAASGREALDLVQHQGLDGIVVDLLLNDTPAIQLAGDILAAAGPHFPPVVLSGMRNPPAGAASEVAALARSAVVRFAESDERLLEETVLLLHRAEAGLSAQQREWLAAIRAHDATLAGRTVLVVDDDVRNIFALTSALEQQNLQVVHAENGRAGIEVLLKASAIDGVLMDIMMPGMDGYETICAIRQHPRFESLPIIAVTARATWADRARCIEAGASDCISKPVDLDQLFSVLRVWLVPSHEPEAAFLTAGG